MRPHPAFIRSAGLSLVVFLAACASPSPPTSAAGHTDALAQVGRWNLQQAITPDGRAIAILAPHGQTVHAVEFADARLTVHGGCNRIGAAYHYAGNGVLVVAPFHSTRMACEDRELMDADAALATLLEGSATWRIAEIWPEQLTIDHDDGSRSTWVADRGAP